MPVVVSPHTRRAAATNVVAPEAFLRQVADALANLNDVPRLQMHPLARRLTTLDRADGGLGRALQQTLLEALERLRPARRSPLERSARVQRLLVLRHVDGLEPAAVWAELGIGKSEYYREHRRGVDALASLLWERLLLLEPPGGSAARLPRPLASFIGRERELAELRALVGRARLVTLTGPPGTGKTRLAIQFLDDLLPALQGRSVFVSLASLKDARLVLPALAQALRLQEQPGREALEQLVDALSERDLLLVLDNFEHVIAAAPQVAALLAACPRLQVLVTSRELLHVSGEHTYALAPLDESDAIQLFAERAWAVRTDFVLTTDNTPTVAAICQRVDRLPLGIELAVGRLHLFEPAALLRRLERRLPLLAGGPRDVPPRQQTLRATIAWSYDLLDAVEQGLFCRLALCVDGCSLDAAQALCGEDVLHSVESLVEKSLLLHAAGLGGEPRLRMLETVREYALERLEESGQLNAARRAHAEYFRHLAERAETEYFGSSEHEWLDRLEQEYANLRAVIEWSLEDGEMEVGLALAGALWRFMYHRDHLSEARDQLRRLLATRSTVAAPSAARAKALFAAASLAVWQGESASGRGDAEASVALWRALGDARGEAMALHTLAHTAVDHARERDLYAESVARFREVDYERGLVWSLQCLANVTLMLGDVDGAEAIQTEALAVARRADSAAGVSGALAGLASLAAQRGDHTRAYELSLQGFELRRKTTDRALTDQLNGLGRAALGMGDPNLAARHFRDSLELCREQGIKWDAAFALAGLAEVAMRADDARHAARLVAAADALLDTIGARRTAGQQAEHDRTLQTVRAALGEEAFEQACASGRAMTREEAIASALDHPSPSVM